MGLFGFGKKEAAPEEKQEGGEESEEEEEPAPEPEQQAAPVGASDGRLLAEVTKIKAQLDSLAEMRKLTSERFTRVSEQIGELRGMIMDTNRAIQNIEVKSAKAIDLVETVQPDKMMIELQKSDAKVEALKAGIESNDSIIKSFREQLKDFRQQVNVFQGVEQTIKLSEEVRKELLDIKKVEALVKRHASRVDDIFVEVSKKFSDYEKFQSQAAELDKGYKHITGDFDSFKIKLAGLAAKKDVENLLSKFNSFEKHAGNLLVLMDRRFETLEKKVVHSVDERLDRVEKLLAGFETLAKKTPDLDKYFKLLDEEARKAAQEKPAEPEKILQPGEEPKQEEPAPQKGIFGALKDKIAGGGQKEAASEGGKK
ncbi:MAG: hypothetical protein QS98_C0009G0003 [archaeon GW2011_AR3]|nr:MAG: hypothetical protein QS98_C0009G0003 [archaeon GW2011_AR3]MBS3110306.1 hypothetical protein [Candidatus Woesearchaeota archaeon]